MSTPISKFTKEMPTTYEVEEDTIVSVNRSKKNVQEISIAVKAIDQFVLLPERAHATDACFDIRANEDVLVQHNKVTKVKTGLVFDLPEGIAALLYGRSGLALKGVMLANAVGVIDSGYRDEVCVLLTNTLKEPFAVRKGDRIAQVRFEHIMPCEIVKVDDVSTTDRNGGLGHTGVK